MRPLPSLPQGLPPNTTAQDKHDWYEMEYLRVSQDQVAAVFQRYGLLDDRVHFHKGYFRYALPAWKAQGGVGPIAMLRMDGGKCCAAPRCPPRPGSPAAPRWGQPLQSRTGCMPCAARIRRVIDD